MVEAVQILTGGKLDPSKISKSPAAVAKRSVPTFIEQERLSMLEIDKLKAQNEEERKKRLADLSKSDFEYAKQVAQMMETSHAEPAPQFIRTYIKNMSDAYYSSGRTMEWANKFKGDDLIAEYNKIKSAVERSTTSQGVKRSRPILVPRSPKKMKSTAGPSLGYTPLDEVPADTRVSTDKTVPADQRVPVDQSVPADASISAGTCVSPEAATTTIPVNAPLDKDEPAEESSSLKRSTRKKSVAKKRTTPPFSSIPFSTDDPDAAHRVHITFASDDSDDDDTPHPIITGVHLLGWQVVPSGLGTIHTLLYTLEVDFSSPVWQDQHKWRVRSWKLYNFPGVYVLELKDGTVLYMLVDREYPFEIGVMEQLLDHKL
nr:hypothetical protein [Tanacetum cinerariifolium]